MDSMFRKLPVFRGKGRAAGILFKRKIERERDLTVIGKFEGFTFAGVHG